jgi:SAM-dependent methyltransferase
MNTYQKLKKLIKENYPNYLGLWDRAEEENSDEWLDEFSYHIDMVFGNYADKGLSEAADGYAEFCTEAIRSQLYFERHGTYQASSYQDVLETCYQSEDYMDRRYLPGQFLSHYVWPHHRLMLRGFVNYFIKKIGDIQSFYEVGVGCGMYSLKVLEQFPLSFGKGFDISQYALDFTKRVVDSHGLGKNYSIHNKDIIADPPHEKCNFVVSQEVLEHLEDPLAFVKSLRAITQSGGFGYITAAINAGHTDHIYLYRTAEEVSLQLTEAGWSIIDQQVECNYPEKPTDMRPTVAGFLVQNT